MHSGTIALAGGAFDLQATLESGQSYLWTREDGRMYDDAAATGGDAWYVTVDPRRGEPRSGRTDDEPGVVRVRQREGVLDWAANFDAEPTLRRRLRLGDDLAAIRESAPDDPVVEAAFDRYWGLRVVNDPVFESLISFICSAQMRVARIHEMQRSLAERFGQPIEFDGRTYHAFPTPERLASATEAQLRDLGLGYRAPYVAETARMVAEGQADPVAAADRAYEAAREFLTQFVGVGQKVADCVCLFALDFLEAVPLDTWIRRTIEEYFPDCDRGNYAETSRAIRERLGGEYAGYVQTYVFHHLRTGGDA